MAKQGMTYHEIVASIEALRQQAAQLKREELSRVLQTLQERGHTLDELIAVAQPSKVRDGRRYRDPASGRTWNGHGKRPRWFTDALGKGKTPDQLRA